MAATTTVTTTVTTTARSSTELQHFGASTPATLGSDDGLATPHSEEDVLDVDGRQEFSSLPPVDRGKDAWFFLAASLLVEAMTWGFPFSFGVFQDYYSTQELFAGSSHIPVIGTSALGIMYLAVPVVMGTQRIYPRFGRWSPMIGLVLMSVALAGSSFSQNVGHLILTQGVLYAIGGVICYCPCLLYMDEWFARRKGLAYGIMWSGTGLAGFSLPLIFESLLNKSGFRTTLRIWAVALLVLTLPLAFFIKPRLPYSATTHIKPFKLEFALTKTFALHQLANVFQGLGFFLPSIYLPTYARSLGAGTFTSALTLLLVNVTSTFGCAAMGLLTDHLHVTTCLMISAAGAGLGTLLLWGFATSLPTLFVYCVIYGLFAGPYSSAWTGIMRQVTTEMATRRGSGGGSSFDPTMVIGVLSTGRGIGNVVSGPLSQVLVKGLPWKGEALGGYGTGYGPLIAFTGATAVMGGATFVWRRLGWM